MKTSRVYETVVGRLLTKVGQRDLGAASAALIGRHIADRVSSGEITWATAKQYASAVRWQLRRDGLETDSLDDVWDEAKDFAPLAKGSRPSNRRSRITPETVATLRALAETREGNGHRIAVTLFHASVLFGLRPCEWAGASWADNTRTTLVVANAKTASRVMDHGPFSGRLWVRGNGAARRLNLSAEGALMGVRDLVDEVIANEKVMPWQRHRSSLYRAFRSLVEQGKKQGTLPRRLQHLTIYSARHQFAADAKGTMNLTAGEVAAAMGHSSARTAISGYGKRMRGGAFAPVAHPDPASVAAVRNVSFQIREPAIRKAPLPAVPSPRM